MAGIEHCVQQRNRSGLHRFTAFHHMKFDSGGGRDRWCDVNCTKQEILKVEREKPDDSTRQFFSPTHNLMPVRKIPFYLPHAFSVFSSKCRPSWVLDYFKSRFIGDQNISLEGSSGNGAFAANDW